MSEEYETPRASPRVDVRLPARLLADDTVVDVETVNLSAGGLLVRGGNLDAHGSVDVEINLDGIGWQRLHAEVVRTSADGGQIAARFADAASSGGRDAIQAFLERYLG